MSTYNWQKSDWPHFRYDLSHLTESFLFISEKMGLIRGKLTHLDEDIKIETMINLMVEEAIKTSEIEGENINRIDVRSSIKNKLGLNQNIKPVRDKRAQGITELLIDSRNTFKEPLSDIKLFEWHIMLFSNSTDFNLRIGTWRQDEELMQIISIHKGRRVVYFEAPPSQKVPEEMQRFIQWFNETAPSETQAMVFPVVRAAIAHLYFESIHPFDDGNGRIGRAISEKALFQGFGFPSIISLSQAIDRDKKAYYEALHSASKSNEITSWIEYLTKIVIDAQEETEKQIDFILKKAAFFHAFENQLNERELKVIKRMFDAGLKGFEGGINARKYIIITKTSKATATRDLHHLNTIQALMQLGSGRSIRYELNLDFMTKKPKNFPT